MRWHMILSKGFIWEMRYVQFIIPVEKRSTKNNKLRIWVGITNAMECLYFDKWVQLMDLLPDNCNPNGILFIFNTFSYYFVILVCFLQL